MSRETNAVCLSGGLNIHLTYRLRIAALEISASIANASRETLEFEVGWH